MVIKNYYAMWFRIFKIKYFKGGILMEEFICNPKPELPARSPFTFYDDLQGAEKEKMDKFLKSHGISPPLPSRDPCFCYGDLQGAAKEKEDKFLKEHNIPQPPVVPIQQSSVIPAPVINNPFETYIVPPKEDLEKVIYKFIDELNQMRVLIRCQDKLYMLDGLIYRDFVDNTFQCNVFNYVQNQRYMLKCYVITRITNELKMRAVPVSEEPNDERFTLCQNGYFNNTTGIMEIGVPDNYFPTIQLTGSYLGSAPQYHPLMDEFMSTLFAGNELLIQRAWEIIGYCISSDAHAKRFFIFPGASGDNGKSTFIKLITNLIGNTATVGMPMKNLLGNNFSQSELYCKRLNVSADEGTINLDSSQLAVLKTLSGHDMITADKKNTNQVSFLCTCKIIIASNHNIGMAYSSGDAAVQRRICTLPFDVKIPKEKQNPNIVNMILRSELDAITTDALNAFIRLKNNGYNFTGDGTGIDEYSIRPNPIDYQYLKIEEFVKRYIECKEGNFVFTQRLYEKFNLCGNYDVFKDITGFSQALNKYFEANGYVVQKCKKHDGNGFEGIAIVN